MLRYNDFLILSEITHVFALVIGINDYLEHPQLKGAVSDADAFSTYLSSNLMVSGDRIVNLRNSQATRAEIIKAFESLRNNPRINRNDPIVIYYAGHGSRILAPKGWEAGDTTIEALVPYDAGAGPPRRMPVYPIPDRTVSALLNKLAEAKGDNIVRRIFKTTRDSTSVLMLFMRKTVIFDCCHSASGTREDGNVPGRVARVADMQNLPRLPQYLDSEILQDDRRGSILAKGFSHREMRSHVLLAACGSDQLAYETNGHGDYTNALLTVLRTSGTEKLTYKGCAQRIPSIPKWVRYI
jgi:hypothetical protein